MFHVTGTADSVAYRVGVHDEPLPEGTPGATGCVMGSDNIMASLRLHEGQSVQATPTSEPVDVDPNDPATVLAFLYATTDVDAVEAEEGATVPDVRGEGDSTPGAIH